MSDILKNNAYNILGLDTSASERDIQRRAKELINRLKIDDIPVYDSDFGLFEDFRSEDAVKDASHRLQIPKKRIKEYFFWFQITNDIDKKAANFLRKKDYSSVIQNWQNASKGQSAKSFFHKKNLAVLYCVLLSFEGNKGYLEDSLATWKELIESDKFWSSFSKTYKLHNEQTSSSEIISDFRRQVLKYLADIYTELHIIHNDSDYINDFQEAFSVKGEKIKKAVLNPAYEAINRAVEELEKMEVSKDGIFDKAESETIKRMVANVQQELNKLIDLGLYNDSQTKIMRDRSAIALRSIALDVHNNLGELEKSKKLHEVAIQLAGTESLKNKLSEEIGQIQNNIAEDAENSVLIEIPGTFRNDSVVFKNSFLIHGKQKIFYKDAISISFSSTANTTRVYGVPVSTTYTYRWLVASERENISLSLSASHDNSKQQEEWAKLVGLTSNLIQPIIIKKIIDKIFNRGETVKIGEIEFTKHGYSRMKFRFFRKNEKQIVYWTDTIYIPKLFQGNVILWEDQNGESKQFTTIPMTVPNAVLIPELVQACYDNREK